MISINKIPEYKRYFNEQKYYNELSILTNYVCEWDYNFENIMESSFSIRLMPEAYLKNKMMNAPCLSNTKILSYFEEIKEDERDLVYFGGVITIKYTLKYEHAPRIMLDLLLQKLIMIINTSQIRRFEPDMVLPNHYFIQISKDIGRLKLLIKEMGDVDNDILDFFDEDDAYSKKSSNIK